MTRINAQLDSAIIREQFPLLKETINGSPLIYFDNAATTQKPQSVIDSITHYYQHDNANVHRAVHTLGERATVGFEDARAKVQHFINAKNPHECIFVRGTTEGINLVAQSFVAPRLLPGEGVLVTHMEHHSNIVPWQMVCRNACANLIVAPISYEGEVLLEEFERKLDENVKFVAISYASNALGTINPVKQMIKMAHDKGALVLLDGAQSTPHLPIDVQELDCDFYAFSSHKMYGPTGIGVVWGREALLDDMAPYQGGGEMINSVRFELTDYASLPHKFEAGTPDIAGAIGLGAAIDYLNALDLVAIREYEIHLLDYLTAGIQSVKGFNIVGTAKHKVPVVSFVHGKIHAHDIGTILDSEGIEVRSGHHCAMPLMDFLEVVATTRVSLSFYNTKAEIDKFIYELQKVEEVFA